MNLFVNISIVLCESVMYQQQLCNTFLSHNGEMNNNGVIFII